MSAHLTHEELTDNLLGVSSLTVNAHLLNCPQCCNELNQMKTTIASFRGAAHAWSEDALANSRNGQIVHRLPKRRWLTARWGLAAAAALVLFVAGFAVYLRDHQPREQAALVQTAAPVVKIETAQSQIDKDNEFLSQVNSELAEAVPAPMQPLRVLESTTSNVSASK